MKNEKLKAIIINAAADLPALVSDAEKDILAAWNSCTEEAQAHEQKPKFKLGFTITLDLDENHMETALTFGLKRKLTIDREIPDPSQPALIE